MVKSKMKSTKRAREAVSCTPDFISAAMNSLPHIAVVASPDFASTPPREPRGHYAGPLTEPPEKEEENDGPPEF